MKGKNQQPRILYPVRLSFRSDGEMTSFPDKQKLREFSTTKPALQQMLTSLGRKHKRRKRPSENKNKTIKEKVKESYRSIITLNVNGLHAPTKTLVGWVKAHACMHFHLPHHSA